LESFYELYLNFNFLNSKKVLKSLSAIWKRINKYRPKKNKKNKILPFELVSAPASEGEKDLDSVEQELGTWIVFRTDDLEDNDKNIPILLYLILDHYIGSMFPV
jgi:hypothetical protein